jgi:hypothetical protein
MAYQDPDFSAFREGDVFEHEDGQRLKLVYHPVKIQGRQDRPLRPYNPPRESLRFQKADEIVDSSNGLSNISLATGPKEMEQLVGANKGGDPWRRWKLLRPTPSSDPNQPTAEETLGTLDEIRTNWNNSLPARPTAGAGSGRRTSTQAEASTTHNPLTNLDTPDLPLGPQQYGRQLPQNPQYSRWFVPGRANQQYASNPASRQNPYTDPLNLDTPARFDYQSQLQGFRQRIVQEPTSLHTTNWGYGTAGSASLGQQAPQQPQSAAQQYPTQQALYQQQTQRWHSGEQTHLQQQADNGNDIGDETDDEHAVG